MQCWSWRWIVRHRRRWTDGEEMARMSDDHREGCARKDVACDFAVPVEWVPENWAELSDDDLLSAVEAARDREIRLRASPLDSLLGGRTKKARRR